MALNEVTGAIGMKERESARNAKFDRVWAEHREGIWRLVSRLAADADKADDLTQEVSLRAFQAFESFRGEAAISTWLYRIAINVVNRHFERQRPANLSWDTPEVKNLPADERTDPQCAALQADLAPVVRAALSRLPAELRTTLVLVAYEGLKYREIAAIMDVPIGTVKSRRHSAIERLREELKDYEL